MILIPESCRRVAKSLAYLGNRGLYLDDLAVTYLHHLGFLPKLAAARFVPIVSQSQIEEAQAILLYDSVADQAGEILEEVRRCLAEGIRTGVVRLGRLFRHDEAEPRLRHHPSIGILSLASEADALVIDDRSVNRHFNIKTDSALRPILTTLDLLRNMRSQGVFSGSELAELRAKLRIAGLALIPVDAAELVSLLAACPVNDGILSESAELRSVREGVLDHVPGRGVAGGVVTMSAGFGRAGQLASAGRLTRGSSLIGAMVSSVM